VITPDLSFARQAIGHVIGTTAVLLLAIGIARSSDKHPKNTNEKTTHDENPN
jgi:ABC-type phosphate transport system permease subunit